MSSSQGGGGGGVEESWGRTMRPYSEGQIFEESGHGLERKMHAKQREDG